MSYKTHFSRFLEADPERLHFAAHSHHLWPDTTFEAQQRAWQDAALLADGKWDRIFAEVYAEAQGNVAAILGLEDHRTLAFGPNTHGFLLRLLSCLPLDRPPRILTTDSEFHSFERQARRLEEDGLVSLTRVPVERFADFPERFAAAAAEAEYDLVYLSQVFFNSGYALPQLETLVAAVPSAETLIVIDGYHGFLALPTDLSAVSARVFYLAGGYKYAMSGEGAAFLHAPPGLAPRPRHTGWFAAFGALEEDVRGRVAYGPDGSRFLGATFDPVALYRLNAVFRLLGDLKLDVQMIHDHVLALQSRFLDRLKSLDLAALHPGLLVAPASTPWRGHFLTFQTPKARQIHDALGARKVVTDYRGNRLRIGFGLYHDADDVERLCGILGEALA